MKQFCQNVFCLLLFLGARNLPVNAAEFWVSTNGSDTNVATRENPLASVNMALRKAREFRRLNQVASNEPMKIILRDGVYPLTRPLLVRPEDSGMEASPTLITAAPGEKPVLSGGVPVAGCFGAGLFCARARTGSASKAATAWRSLVFIGVRYGTGDG